MATIEIRRKTNKVWQHVSSDLGTYIVSKMYCKTNGDTFQIVESGGSKRGEYNFSDITIYDDVNSGGAEIFASSELLMKRLEALNYVGFYYDGEVLPANLISTDASNDINLGTDGKLFSSGGGAGSTDWSDLTNFNLLTDATTPLAGTEEIAIVQSGETKKVAVSEVGGDSEYSFMFSQRNVRISAALTSGNWYGYNANTNFQLSNFPNNYGADILSITNSSLRSMNGFVIDGLNVKMLNYINLMQHFGDASIDFEIEVWKYDFLQNTTNATANNLRRVINVSTLGQANNITGDFKHVISTDAEDTPLGYFSKYIIFLRTNTGANFIYPSIDWNFKL